MLQARKEYSKVVEIYWKLKPLHKKKKKCWIISPSQNENKIYLSTLFYSGLSIAKHLQVRMYLKPTII